MWKPPPKIAAVLFDLDGTLLAMRSAGVRTALLYHVLRRFSHLGPRWKVAHGLWRAIRAMQMNEGAQLNVEVLVAVLAQHLHRSAHEVRAAMDDFYARDSERFAWRFQALEGARDVVLQAHGMGLPVVLATNPVFPERVVRMRMRWGGLDDLPFQYMSSADSMRYCKPKVNYFRAVCAQGGFDPAQCIMVGNDPNKDLAAIELGMHVFLLRSAKSYAHWWQLPDAQRERCWVGSIAQLQDFFETWRPQA